MTEEAKMLGQEPAALDDKARIRQLTTLVDRLKKRVVELEQAIRSNAMANAQQAQRLIDARKARIDDAMRRFSAKDQIIK